jgi:hypothetical protein
MLLPPASERDCAVATRWAGRLSFTSVPPSGTSSERAFISGLEETLVSELLADACSLSLPGSDAGATNPDSVVDRLAEKACVFTLAVCTRPTPCPC